MSSPNFSPVTPLEVALCYENEKLRAELDWLRQDKEKSGATLVSTDPGEMSVAPDMPIIQLTADAGVSAEHSSTYMQWHVIGKHYSQGGADRPVSFEYYISDRELNTETRVAHVLSDMHQRVVRELGQQIITGRRRR